MSRTAFWLAASNSAAAVAANVALIVGVDPMTVFQVWIAVFAVIVTGVFVYAIKGP